MADPEGLKRLFHGQADPEGLKRLFRHKGQWTI